MTGRPPVSPLARYARQLVLPELGPVGQERLRSARVLVVGCGGLGAPVIQQLAAAGVGGMTLVDDDVVEVSNLNRQTLFGEADVGDRKAVVAAGFVRRLDSDIDVQPLVERVTTARARRLVAAHDVTVDCSDGLPTKYLLNDAAVRERRPLIHGAATAWSGQVLVVRSPQGPCLRCLFPSLPPRGSLPTCRTAGILGAVTSVVGSFQAAEAVKVLVGDPRALSGRFLAIDVLEPSTRVMTFPRDPACPACGDLPICDAEHDADYDLPVCEDED